MKVIRHYSDYYDGVLSNFAQEQVPFYNRESKIVDKKIYRQLRGDLKDMPEIEVVDDPKITYDNMYTASRRILDLSPAILGFCGKLYLVYYQMHYSYKEFRMVERPETSDKAYPSIELLRDSYKDIKLHFYYANSYGDKVENVYKEWECNKKLENIFLEQKTPIFLYTNKQIVLNPCLKEFNIQKILHPYTAVQELEMFLNNQLCANNTPIMPVGDDVVIAKSKGFDKWSFRKKGKKKK